jgi:hypothetical protein
MRRRAGVLVLALGGMGCVPHLPGDPSLVVEERLLAVRADPAEVAPGGTVMLTALDADASGPVPGTSLAWAACLSRLPLAEPGPIARACVLGDAAALGATTMGPSATVTISPDACRLFGPDPPPAQAGQPAGRPVDPDSTGGYVQPVRVALEDGTVAFASVRLTCGVAGATRDQSAEMRRRYHVNTHPVLSSVVAVHDDGSFQELAPGVPLHVTTGETIVLRVSWPECPTVDTCGDTVCGADEDRTSCAMDCAMPVGCAGAERYVRFDRATNAVVVERESLRVSWLATLGHFDEPRTGRAGSDLATTTEGTWRAPDAAASGALFVVLRDDREGVTWLEVPLVVDG